MSPRPISHEAVSGYRDHVPVSRSHPRVDAAPYLEDKKRFENHWVAVKDGEIVAAAETSRDLVVEMRRLGSRAAGATAEFVRPAADGYIVGVG